MWTPSAPNFSQTPDQMWVCAFTVRALRELPSCATDARETGETGETGDH